jgi:hypothetical protein
MTNKDNAIRDLESYKPRRLGSGVQTATLDQIALENTGRDIVSPEQVKQWRKEAAKANPNKPNYWIFGGIVVSVVATAILLLKYKIIKL